MAADVVGHWFELGVTSHPEAVDVVAALFAEHGLNESVVIEEPFTQNADGDVEVDPSLPVMVSTYLDADDASAEEVIDCMREAISRLQGELDVSDLVIRSVAVSKGPNEGWDAAWQARASLLPIGRRVVVKAPWHDYEPAPDEIVIDLEVGMAFGAGGHPSTRLVTMALEEAVAPGARVLDVGTGTGILAIAGARLGAAAVDAVDIEPVAVQVARKNAWNNGVADIVRVELGSVGLGEPFQGEYDVVVANILGPVLVRLASSLAESVRRGGTLILGGISDFREAAVRVAFAAQGMRLCRRDEREGWVMLVLRKPEA